MVSASMIQSTYSDPTGLFNVGEFSLVNGIFNTFNKFQKFVKGFKAYSAKTAAQVVDWTIVLGQLSAGFLAPAGDLTANTITLFDTKDPRSGIERKMRDKYFEESYVKLLYENKLGSGSLEAEASIDGATASLKIPSFETSLKGGGAGSFGGPDDADLPLVELDVCGGIKVGEVNLNAEYAVEPVRFEFANRNPRRHRRRGVGRVEI